MFKECFKFYKHINSLEQQLDVIDLANGINTEFMVSYQYSKIYLNKNSNL